LVFRNIIELFDLFLHMTHDKALYRCHILSNFYSIQLFSCKRVEYSCIVLSCLTDRRWKCYPICRARHNNASTTTSNSPQHTVQLIIIIIIVKTC